MQTPFILLVDDEPSVLKLVRPPLEEMAHVVQVFRVADALSVLEQEVVDGIILDGEVRPGPGGTTTELAQKLDAEKFPGLRIAISENPDRQKELTDAGFEDSTKADAGRVMAEHLERIAV